MTPTTMRVKIFHHLHDDEVRRFQTGDPLREAIVFDTVMRDGVESVLHHISTALRIAPKYGCGPKPKWTIEYRQRHGNFRLEIGDVVVVGEQAWAVKGSAPQLVGLRGTHAEWEPVSLMSSEILSDDGAA